MKLIVRANRSRPLTRGDTGQLVRVAVGSHVGDGLHAAAYTATTGKWGVIVLEAATSPEEPHSCNQQCTAQTELLATAAAIAAVVTWEHQLIVTTCDTPTAQLLKGVRTKRLVPQGIGCPLDTLIVKSFTQLTLRDWEVLSTLTSPAADAGTMCHIIHQAVTGGATTIAKPLATQLAQQAAAAFRR